jgi:glycosyltransferase involved in cell wall biosynthesis
MHTYVQANTGWFSGRSACYLASGRPVIAQETGWSAIIPNGCGLFPFADSESAVAAIQQIEAEPQKNGRTAREIAEEVFDSGTVLSKMLEDMGL